MIRLSAVTAAILSENGDKEANQILRQFLKENNGIMSKLYPQICFSLKSNKYEIVYYSSPAQ